MNIKNIKLDKQFLLIILFLTFGGFFIFMSASLSLLVRQGPDAGSVTLNQSFGLILGLLLLFITSKIDYRFWRKWAFYIFIAAIILNVLVFIPGIGFNHNGATRWINLGFFTFQPSEFLKVAFIFYFSAWISSIKERVRETKYGLIPFLIIISIVGGIVLLQSDTDVLISIFTAGLAMLFVAGIKWRDIGVLILLCIISLFSLIYFRPYVKDRIMTYLNPTTDKLTSGYQINQSLIAIGSGGITGKGFGQSIQKFGYLPEPIGDSIFAVYSEEFGFIGAVLLILLYLFFITRGLKIASLVNESFGKMVCIGIITVIAIQSFMNIGAITGLIPLSGMPLPFVSHGGTALMIVLAEVGIVLNISKSRRVG